MKVIGILLAAGFSRRFGTANKLMHLLPDGQTIGLTAAQNLITAIPDSVAVIRPDQSAFANQLQQLGYQVITCDPPAIEMADSLTTAVKWVKRHQPNAGMVIALADMPFIKTETIKAVADQITRGALITMPSYTGQRGHPVGFSAELNSELSSLSGDEGARSIIRKYTDQVHTFECNDPGVLQDIDTLDDIHKHTQA
jgi:molybdenum cofactor cytidylyltransferase